MHETKLLPGIHCPEDIKKLDEKELHILASELREEIIGVVSSNGGHLASNLGIVEATIAIHRVYTSPRDRIIFDVGHQCYAHKLLTGRYEAFSTLRQAGGLSGFTKRSESEYDPFGAGHCGTSLSAALGFANADRIDGNSRRTVAFIGDGSFTNGMVYEALNNCDIHLPLTIILNENDMSISQNVGGLSRYLTKIRVSKRYFTLKHNVQRFLRKFGSAGKGLITFFRGIKNFFKRVLLSGNFFEHLGVSYIGPLDGNDISRLVDVLNEANTREEITLVHIVTKKGLGYPPAEEHPDYYHSVGRFDPAVGAVMTPKNDFSSKFGETMCSLAAEDENVCAVTAAMCAGTGLERFSKLYPERFFDVGIAEEHAATFCCGLAAGGKKAVFAVYSTFAQRTFDQLLHDAAMQSLPIVLAVDRSGLVPGDGVTHQGIYDVSMLSGIPGISIYSPDSYSELADSLKAALTQAGTTAVRYPKGAEAVYDRGEFADFGDFSVYGDGKKCIITYGRLTANALSAAKAIGNTRVIKLKKILPIDFDALFEKTCGCELLYLLEEGIRSGGIAEKIAAEIAQRQLRIRVMIHAIDGIFAGQGDQPCLDKMLGFDAASLENRLTEI